MKRLRGNTTSRVYNPVPVEYFGREADLRRYVIVYHQIINTPWEEDDSHAFHSDVRLLQSTVESFLNKRGQSVMRFDYSRDRWELGDVTISFADFPREFFHKIRKYVMFRIISDDFRALATIKSHVSKIGAFFRHYGQSHPCFELKYVHTWDIVQAVKECNRSSSGKVVLLECVLMFYRFLNENYRDEHYDVDLKVLSDLIAEIRHKNLRENPPGHHSAIPLRLFYPLHFKMVELMRRRFSFDDTVLAATVLIFLWTGLRPKEVRLLRRNSVVKTDGEEPFYFINYNSSKNGNRAQAIFLFDAALEAIRTLEKLQDERNARTDYLISFKNNDTAKPQTEDSLRGRYRLFFQKYFPDEKCPCLYSYRVTLCTYLINHGFDNRWVENNMGHLSHQIMGTYYRVSRRGYEEMGHRLGISLGFE